MMGQEYFWWSPFWMFPMIMPVIMVVILVFALYLIFGRSGSPPPCGPFQGREETALDILKKRYAKGEINKEEFERMKKDILD
ncbi:MAG: SHOCT domain-containing protein [Deltaproteobacteria bacterium]|nr:MAG: SHOCT domain-containing protein [Deltaproteobacteria bacterium]